MKAALAAALLLTLTACSIGEVPLPKANATVGATQLTLPLGSYCWSSGGKAQCADIAPPDELLRTGYLQPIQAAAETPVNVNFDRGPRKVDVTIAWATPPASTGPIESSDGSFLLPSAAGVCIFAINGEWPEGKVSFLLAVDIQAEVPG